MRGWDGVSLVLGLLARGMMGGLGGGVLIMGFGGMSFIHVYGRYHCAVATMLDSV